MPVQLADQSVFSPVSRMNTASDLARSLTVRATACGWIRSSLRWICLPVQHGIPILALLDRFIPEAGIGLGSDTVEQQLEARPSRSGHPDHGGRAPSQHLRAWARSCRSTSGSTKPGPKTSTRCICLVASSTPTRFAASRSGFRKGIFRCRQACNLDLRCPWIVKNSEEDEKVICHPRSLGQSAPIKGRYLP